MNKKKTIILLVIGILLVTISSIGITYSYMKPKTEKENNQTEIGINNCAKITLKDNSSTINLTNMYPMEEEMGLQTTPYKFTISSTCEEYTEFNLYLLTYSDNGIADDLIRYGITSKNDTVLETNLITKEEASDITEEEIEEINQGINKGYSKIYKIYSNNIPLKGESEYKLHIWLDENANNDTMNKNIKLGVIVKGYEREETMAEYIIAHKDNTLIYHDGKPDYEGMPNADLEAEDLSYRFTGGNDEVNNYICFGGECSNDQTQNNYKYLYRIIGLFKNDQNQYEIKIIKADGATKDDLGDKETVENSAYSGKYNTAREYYIGKNFDNLASYYWNSTLDINLRENVNMWKYSNLNKNNLNIKYYNLIKEPYKEIIVDHDWQIGGFQNINANVKTIYNKELGINKLTKLSKNCYTQGNTKERLCNEINDLTYEDKIGLMYMSDYLYGTLPEYWTITSGSYNQDDVKNKNWLYLGLNEWTITRGIMGTSGFDGAFRLDYTGIADYNVNIQYMYVVRPVMYLKNNVRKDTNSGTGTAENPYRITI